MAASQVTHVRVPPPRQLNNAETLQSLEQWYRTFKQYYKRDSHFKIFTLSTTVWDPEEDTFGFTAEPNGLKRQPLELKEDCIDFLHALSSYMPYGYLIEKFLSSVSSLKNAFDVICEHYGVSPSQESLLDFILLQKDASESYRQYHERLLAFARQHLTKANVVVDGVNSGVSGDRLTISHMNLITLLWLKNISPALVNIVKTEYSLELRQNTQLVDLVPRISVNIDSLLARYDQGAPVQKIEVDQGIEQPLVSKIQRKNPVQYRFKKKTKPKFCHKCFYLGDKLGIDIQHSHSPDDCPRQQSVINMIQSEECAFVDAEADIDDSLNVPEGNTFTTHNISNAVSKVNQIDCSGKCSLNENNIHPILTHVQQIVSMLRREKSPTILLNIAGNDVVATIDEGAEVSCVNLDIAKKLKLPITKTSCAPVAANKSPMRAIGETASNLYATVKQSRVNPIINLGNILVISNLGVDLLIGQPTKVDTEMVSVPHKRLVYFRDINGFNMKVPYYTTTAGHSYMSYRPQNRTVMYPKEEIEITLPDSFTNARKVCVVPRSNHDWLQPQILDNNRNKIKIKNNSLSLQFIDNTSPLVDIRSCSHIPYQNDSVEVHKVLSSELDPISIETPSDWDYSEDFTDDVLIDPDNGMSQEYKHKFHSLVNSFSSIINYRPGRYNGKFGMVDNTIDFATIPPPTAKIHLPNYSEDMLQRLADKMDEMEKWNILITPESVGVTPVFVSPSLLVPKDDGKWRVVTNFTGLNCHIRKAPALSPTIEEAKLALAKFKHIATLDLSHYYYQNGMSRNDMQYLATHHPYKGIRIYAVEPQGLKNASEHAYERLARILGDLCQEGFVTRQADGIYVGANTLDELYVNLQRVLQRLKDANLTVKPSKFVIAPKKITLFGWEKNEDGWRPLEHTISPLTMAQPPTTVKQLRSWLGAAKQVSQCIPDYAVVFSPLEAATGGRSSPERITWSDALLHDFTKAKEAIKNIKTVHFPHPDDTLHLFSDYSQANHAVGGRLEVHKKEDNGSISILHGGFFSCKIPPSQARWQPCEGESLAVRLVAEHFRPILRESNNTTIVHCDNLPTCQAWQRSKQGHFSNSSKVSAFLLTLSTLNVELVHKSGRLMTYSDYASRNPMACSLDRCQICVFVNDINSAAQQLVNNVNISDFQDGKISMPLIQREAWRTAQSRDNVLSQLLKLINTGQLPDKKKTRGDNTTLKALHNLYKKGDLHVDRSNLITVKRKQNNGSFFQAIVVPQSLFPALASAIHLKTSHPSKLQLSRLLARHFFSPGQSKVISDVTDRCHTCLSLKQLPKTLFPEMTTTVDGFGCNFSADVMVRLNQKILVVREKMSQFVLATLIQNETAEALTDALLPLISDYVPDRGAVVRTDNAPAFQKIVNITKQVNSPFRNHNITIELGDTLNPNKNPVGENAIKELEKELLRLNLSNKQVTPVSLAMAVKNINSRIRDRGFSAKEMCFRRSQTTNESIKMDDSKLIKSQLQSRQSHHNTLTSEDSPISVGNLVMVKDKLSKNEARQVYVVTNLTVRQNVPYATIQKFDDKFLSRQYELPVAKLMLLPNQENDTEIKYVNTQLPVKVPKTQSTNPPVHAWSYQQFCDIVMDDSDSYSISQDTCALDELCSSNASTIDDDVYRTEELDTLSHVSVSMGETPPSSTPDYRELTPHASPNAEEHHHHLHPVSAQQVDLSKVQYLDEALLSVPLEFQHRLARRQAPSNYAVYHSTGSKASKRGGRKGER